MSGALLASLLAVTCPVGVNLEHRPTIPCLTARGQLLTPRISFAPNSAKLTNDGERAVALAAVALKRYAQPVEVRGHLDAPERYGIRLSQRRAEAVRAALIAAGVARERLTAKGFGQDQPLFNPRVPARNRLNRRIEIWLDLPK